jgi:NitT/TauT family transport system substrate-binding protein
VRDQTIRVLMTLAPRLDTRPDVFARYVQAYRETVDWMYAGDEPLEMYAEFAGVPLEIARQVREKFFPKSLLVPDRVSGLDGQMADAVTFKYLNEPLTKAQLAELIRIPPPK